MSLEERMLERFTRERQRGSKGIMFNLEDVDDLTHYGQSLSKLDDFDDIGLRMESDDEDETSGIFDVPCDTINISRFTLPRPNWTRCC